MNAAAFAFGLARRLRRPAAGVIGALGLALLWTGFGMSELLVLQREAVAESAPIALYSAPLSLISEEQAAILQSTVDSAALSLGGVFAAGEASSADDGLRPAAIASALSALTFGLGGEVYFTMWKGTTVMHAPLSPDAEGMDFADAVDGRGAAFVLGMRHAAASGGGFLQVFLPRQFSGPKRPDAPDAAPVGESGAAHDLDLLVGEVARVAGLEREKPEIPAAVSADTADVSLEMAEILTGMPDYCPISNSLDVQCGNGSASQAPSLEPMPVEQVVYVRRIPRSGWHIAAFMPVDIRPGQGIPSTWNLTAGKTSDRREADYLKGLCVSGFSLAGLAGLMLVPGRTRRDGDGA